MNIKENEQFTEIKDFKQFKKNCKAQNINEICSRADVAEIAQKLEDERKPYTIFSIIFHEGSLWTFYITYGMQWINNIGYCILEGNFKLPNEINFESEGAF